MYPRLSRDTGRMIAAVAALLLLASCTRGGTPTPQRHTLEDFDFLVLEMTYGEVTAEVGPADENVGSGLTIYLYHLDDGTDLLLNFGADDSLIRVFRAFPDGTRELILGSEP